MYEYLRLYAWMVLPVYLAWAFIKSYRKPEIVFVAPLILVWLAGRASLVFIASIPEWDMPQWVSDGTIDALSASFFIALSLICLPRRPHLYIALSFILDVIINCAYGWRDMHYGYDIMAHRACYWTLFAVAWGQAIYATRRGGWSRGKRWRLGNRSLHSFGGSNRSVYPRMAGAGLFRGAGE
jgi:hypothetical protein